MKASSPAESCSGVRVTRPVIWYVRGCPGNRLGVFLAVIRMSPPGMAAAGGQREKSHSENHPAFVAAVGCVGNAVS